MKLKISYLYILIILAFGSCEDYYVPELEDLSNTLVVEAILTDKPDYVTVKLSRSVPFENRSNFYGENDAQVLIYTVNGDYFNFFETSNGYYRSKDSIYAKTGEKYFLKVLTQDGEVYKSEVEEMMAPNKIEDVQFNKSVLDEVNYNFYGDPFVKKFDGISFSVLPSTPVNSQVGFLYKWNLISNYSVYSIALPYELNYYCWKKIRSNKIYVYDYNQEETANQIILDDLHFISNYNLSPIPIDSLRFEGEIQKITTSSFYYQIKQYTITKKGADFWKSVKNQSEANGKLFDPVEEELTTNIYCTSNSNIHAFGFFNTAAYTERIIAVKLRSHIEFENYDVEVLPAPEQFEDCNRLEDGVTDFWIN